MTVIEVFADVTCPFTHVGFRRFVERRDELNRSDVVLYARAWPLEIVNGQPLDAHHIAAVIGQIQQQIAPSLFQGFVEASFPISSLRALTLAAAASSVSIDRVALSCRSTPQEWAAATWAAMASQS